MVSSGPRAPALFATAYGNVGSSIYYALGLTAGIALGLTPIVFIISGLIFAATAATYAEGTVRIPRRAARRASRVMPSTSSSRSGPHGPDAQLCDHRRHLGDLRAALPLDLLEPLRTNPWDIVVGIVLTWLLVGINIVGIKEAASLNVFLAVIDFATQLLLVLLGFFLIFHPHVLRSNVHFGVAPTSPRAPWRRHNHGGGDSSSTWILAAG